MTTESDPVEDMIAAAKAGVPVHVYRERKAKTDRRNAEIRKSIEITHKAFGWAMTPADEPSEEEDWD